MTREEFLNIIKEDKFFEDFNQHSDYRFPAVKYYLEETSPIMVNGHKVEILEIKSDEDRRLVNYCFKMIKEKMKI